MRPLSLAAVLLFLTGPLHAQTLGPVDWIFLVDTSKSMRGIGGTKDIWADVKGSLDSFVDETSDEDTVAIYTFDRDVRLHSAAKIDAAARADLHAIIHSLKAEGDRTHLGAAIAKGLERAESLRARADPRRSRVVVLFTDGKEDVRGIENWIPIDANLARVADTFLFFVSMGEHEKQLDDFAGKTRKQTTVLRAPTTEAIRNIAREIRPKIPPPPAPPPPVVRPLTAQVPEPPPPSSPWLKVAIALALLAAIAYFAIQQQRGKNRLEGELEVLRPDAAFVGLPGLRASEVTLSSILPVSALAGSDARLFVRRKAGRKKVWIAAQSGSLRINDVETPESELYDADTIDIGDARLRFNRVGDERPFETNQEGDL